jgi:nitroreductase/NAD-dependent dihydropyrimidine dehydrogenase PreA subunit
MVRVNENLCTLCGTCIPVCVRGIIRKGERSVEITDPATCLSCGHCKAVCPVDAFQFPEGNDQFLTVPMRKEMPSAAVFYRLLRRRRSLRVYQDRPVERAKLKMLIEAGRYAPTGSNRQACEFVVVSGRKALGRICNLAILELQRQGSEIQEAINQHNRLKKPLPEELAFRQILPSVWERMAQRWKEGGDQLFYHAPAVILVHMKKNIASTPEIDAAIASTQMVLLAETLGLGTCYNGFLIRAVESSGDLKKISGVPPENRALVAFTVGYPGIEFRRFVARNPAKVTWLGEFED